LNELFIQIIKSMILIVDDNNQVRRMIRNLVEDLDVDFCECEDGSEALSAYRENHPDWVLMDVQMKEMDGLTATRQIKSFFPKAKVIILTNHSDAKTRQAAMDAGASEFVGKENLIALRDIIINRIH
jgi:CheY-like chemotaxis protein